jgi:hypothetical protein
MDTPWMTWAEFMAQCHRGRGLPREALDDLLEDQET